MVIGMTDEEQLKYHVYKSAEQYEYLSLQAKSDQFWDDYSDFHSLRVNYNRNSISERLIIVRRNR